MKVNKDLMRFVRSFRFVTDVRNELNPYSFAYKIGIIHGACKLILFFATQKFFNPKKAEQLLRVLSGE